MTLARILFRRKIVTALTCFWGLCTGCLVQADESRLEVFDGQLKPLIVKYRIRCYGPKGQEGDLRLDQLDLDLVRGNDRDRFNHDSAGDLNGAKGGVYEAGHRVPFIVSWPGVVQAGAVCDRLVALTDVMGTLSSILGKPLPQDVGQDSIDFTPLLRGGQVVTREMMPHLGRPTTLRYQKYKYIDGKGGAGFLKVSRGDPGDSPVQVYDLSDDTGEASSVIESHPEIASAMSQKIRDWLSQKHPTWQPKYPILKTSGKPAGPPPIL